MLKFSIVLTRHSQIPSVWSPGLGSFWVLDPIDGTKGFLRKEQYAICLCLVKDGTIMVSALGCPNLPVPWQLPFECPHKLCLVEIRLRPCLYLHNGITSMSHEIQWVFCMSHRLSADQSSIFSSGKILAGESAISSFTVPLNLQL